MKLLLFCVYDAAAEAYLPPFLLRSKGEAIRSFAAAVKSEDHAFHRNADDYTLFQVGEFDDSSGMVSSCAPVSLGVAVEYLDKYRAPDGKGAQIELEDAIAEVTNARR